MKCLDTDFRVVNFDHRKFKRLAKGLLHKQETQIFNLTASNV